MMPKQLPDIRADKGFQEDARNYAKGVYQFLRCDGIEKALADAFLIGAQRGFSVGYRYCELHGNDDVKGWE